MWGKLDDLSLIRQSEKIKEKCNLINMARNKMKGAVEVIFRSIRKIGCEKINKVIREAEENLKKIKRKKLRRK